MAIFSCGSQIYVTHKLQDHTRLTPTKLGAPCAFPSLSPPYLAATYEVRNLACVASNNKLTRGRLAEGYGLHVLPNEAISLQD